MSNKNVTYVCLFHWRSFQHLSDSKLCLKKSVLVWAITWHQSQLPYLHTRLLELLVYHTQSQGLVLIILVYLKILFHVVGFVKYNIKILLLLLFILLFWYQCCSSGCCYDCCNCCYFEKMICIHCLNRFLIFHCWHHM